MQTLVLFDGPQVALLRTDRSEFMLAVACEYGDFGYGFFGCELTRKTLSNYLEEKCDLRYVFTKQDFGKQYYFFDWSKLENNLVHLQKASKEELQKEEFYPQAGFFSRFHTKPYALGEHRISAAHAYTIDGKWSASDFSRFYGKMADLYAFIIITSPTISSQLSDVDRLIVKRAAAEYFWQGGGSYVGFYDRIFSHINVLNPLQVASINYASPGTIKMKGNIEGISEVNSIITNFQNNSVDIVGARKAVEKVLKNERLRRAPRDSSFSTPAMSEHVKANASKLLNKIGVANTDTVFELCGSNVLVYAKIALSFYRRGKDLYQFKAEGRITDIG